MKRRMRKALFHPLKALKRLWESIERMREVFEVLGFLGIRFLPATALLARFFSARGFWQFFHEQIARVEGASHEARLGGWLDFYSGLIIYAVMRSRKPQVVVETGVGPGSSSSFILRALDENGAGHLYSIDLPGRDAEVYPAMGKAFNVHVPRGFSTGWLVPEGLRDRWSLTLGDSKTELHSLLSRLGKVDVFMHDSLHTDEHVKFELATVLPFLERNGILLADDVNSHWSLAFVDFCKSVGIPFRVYGERLGVAVRA
jgi:hypothetical protein